MLSVAILHILLLVGVFSAVKCCHLSHVHRICYLFQAKILYKDVPFSEEEREHIKLVIQSNVYSYIGMLLEGRERFEEESLNELRRNQSVATLEGIIEF